MLKSSFKKTSNNKYMAIQKIQGFRTANEISAGTDSYEWIYNYQQLIKIYEETVQENNDMKIKIRELVNSYHKC